MKIVKRRLPEGVRKIFEVKIGKKVKVLNSLYYGKDKVKKTVKEETKIAA